MGKDFQYRVIFRDEDAQRDAEEYLDENDCRFDYDSGDCMMLAQDGLDCLYDSGIDFDEV